MSERVWVKICGLTTNEAVHAAIDAGADAIGFVFAPSKREVTPARAAELANHAPRPITRVAVMLHPTQAQVDEVCEVFRPDAVQTDAADFGTLRLPMTVHALPVVRGRANTRAARILFEGPVSGSGKQSDWTLAAELARTTQLVLAGGLTPGNVREAITRVRPFGVDVSSGVESQPGVKDTQKIYEFVRNVRTGAME